MSSADLHQKRFSSPLSTQYEGLHNGIDFAAQSMRRFPGRSGVLPEMDCLQSEIEPVQRGLHPADGFFRRRFYQRSSLRGRMTV